jgi:hypothetical protein
VLWSIAFLAGYSLLRVSGYFWYTAPLVPGLAVLAALGAYSICRLVSTKLPKTYGVFMAVVLLVVAAPMFQSAQNVAANNDNRLELYRRTGEWLLANTAPQSATGTLEVGIIGNFGKRRLIDFAGLLQPDVNHQIRRETTYDDLAVYAWSKYRPEYVALLDGTLRKLRDAPSFVEHCAEATRIQVPSNPSVMVIYDCRTARLAVPYALAG